jgi:hypothetical protein
MKTEVLKACKEFEEISTAFIKMVRFVKRLLDIVKESNERMQSKVVLTPLDFVRLLNREKRRTLYKK